MVMTWKEKFKPAVNKNFLLFLAGFLWIGVGVMLMTFAAWWLLKYGQNNAWIFVAIGLACSIIIHSYGFLRIVDKNLGRISKMEGKRCAFSFMTWKSYGIVVIMVTMGIALRHSTIPKQYLSVLYIAIGMALFLSSIRYFRNLISSLRETV
jgi:membrane protease YdiL (CAAX protease family)